MTGTAELFGRGWSGPGALLGLLVAVGLRLTWLGLPVNRTWTLTDRLEPYLRDAPTPSRLLAHRPNRAVRGRAIGRFVAPFLADAARTVGRILGDATSVRRRLLRAGRPADVDAFRAQQVLWGAAGMTAGVLLAVLAAATRGASAVPVAAMVLAFALAGVWARDVVLSHQATAREQRMLAEFPTVAELLALAVSAGESAAGALDRVCRLSRGDLTDELGACLADARAGATLPAALQGLSDRTGLISLARFVDGIVVAVERGTPLADVLRAQAQDVRETRRRDVMEAGGRKEIAMMVPVVFLVLPVTVLFAVFPGYTFLHLSI